MTAGVVVVPPTLPLRELENALIARHIGAPVVDGGRLVGIVSRSDVVRYFEQQGSAMMVFGVAALLAPVVGPTLGGFITDNYGWLLDPNRRDARSRSEGSMEGPNTIEAPMVDAIVFVATNSLFAEDTLLHL